ncbi:mucoidy inhibitor MuiA family protein [Flavobacterium sp. j3]|uniref:Mucoidy inhibitor MuiA family protein n=1 Tax=Flavobacterium aureirubrum TaxID=3133147 RepID=A0ABU9N933_9FLAO
MKKIILVLLSTINLFATEIKTKATPREVTVYTSGAQITSDVSATIPAGTTTLRIIDLSPFVNQNTIQISGLKDISILSIGFENIFYPKKIMSDKIKTMQAEILFKQREISVLQSYIKGLEEEESLLSINKSLGSNQQAVTLEKILLHSKHYRERVPIIKMEIYDTSKKISILDSEVKIMQLEMQKMTGDSEEQKGEIIVKLNNPRESVKLNMTLKYNVSGAGWVPSYEIKANNTKDALQFIYKAQVYQKTGENWEDIKITLSTGNPTENNDKPKVESQYLNFIYSNNYVNNRETNKIYTYNPMVKVVSGVVTENGMPLPGANIVVKGTNRATQTDFDGRYTIKVENGKELVYSFVGMEDSTLPVYSTVMNVNLKSGAMLEEVVVQGYRANSKVEKADITAVEEDIQVTGSGDEKEVVLNTVVFKISKNYSIPSLDTPSMIEIDKFTIPAEFEYFAAPLLNENVFLTAKVKDWNKYDLLPGDASIYLEGTYAGTTYINPYQTDEELIVSMGIDANLVIERKQLNNLKDKSLFGTTKIVNRNYEITLRNNKTTDVLVKVYDRIPVSQNKEIKVDTQIIDSAQYDEKTGILFWNISLNPKQTAKKQLGYQVKYPRNKKVNL